MEEQINNQKNLNIPLDDKGFLMMDDIKSVVGELTKQKDFQGALNYLNHIKDNASIKSTASIIELHDLYIQILLDIEDYQSLLNILKSKQKYIENPKDKNMHLFYMAICYEGLGDIDQAIQSLEDIQDILSSKNMANKYIKLSILYANQHKLAEAKDALKHAEVFDHQKQNDMFLLAESDIYYQEKEYYKAIKTYEDFFIKSKRQMSYLNRFIRISLALERTTDVYDFYSRYKEKVMKSSSIQAKLSFFGEILDMLKSFHQDEYIEVNDYIESLNQRHVIDFDDFGYFQTILKQSKHKKIYQKEREVVRDYFMDLDETKAFEKLIYVKVIDAKLHAWHYSKKLLLEKDLNDDHMIASHLIHHKTHPTYGRTDIEGFEFVSDECAAIFVENIQDDAYFLGYTSIDNYDLAKRLSLLSSGLLSQKIDHFKLLKTYLSLDEGFRGLINDKGFGLIRIHENHVICLNNQANQLLDVSKDVIKFDAFQSLVQPMIYLDEFIQDHQFEVTIHEQSMILTSTVVDEDIYILIEKEKEVEDASWQSNQQHSLIMLDVYNHHQLKNDMGYASYFGRFTELKTALHNATNHHIIDLVNEDDHSILMYLDTRDKRIFDRLDHKLLKLGFDAFDIRMAYHHFNHDINQTKHKLLKLLSFTTPLVQKQSGDLPIRKDEEKNRIYLETIQNLLKHKSLPLNHAFIRAWKTKKITHIDIDYAHMNILFDETRVKKILKANQLEILFDRLITNQVIEDAKSYDQKTTFIIPISKASVNSKKAFNYLLRRLEKLKHQYYFKCDMNDYLSLTDKDKQYLMEKETPIALYGDLMDIHTLESIYRQKMYIMSYRTVESDLIKPWLEMLKQRFEKIVYDHQDQILKRTVLENLEIDLVKGAFSGSKEIEKT